MSDEQSGVTIGGTTCRRTVDTSRRAVPLAPTSQDLGYVNLGAAAKPVHVTNRKPGLDPVTEVDVPFQGGLYPI